MIKKIALVIFLVFVYSWDDFCFPADWNKECEDVVRISDLVQTPFGSTVVEVSIVTDGEYYGGDTSCANVAWCLSELFSRYPRVIRVEIMNDPNEWVPSTWRSLDLCHARLLNEPWQEYDEYGSEDDFLADCYEVQYPDKIDLAWHD